MKEDTSGVIDVRRRGEYFRVRGVSGGREVVVDVPAAYISGKSRDAAKAEFSRAVATVARAQAQGDS